MKRVLSATLCLLMVLSLAACSSEKDALVGSWQGEYDMASILNESMTAGDPEMAQFLNVSRFSLNYTITFGEDGSYQMSVDRKALEEAFWQAMEEIETGIYDYFAYFLDSEGIEMDVESFLALGNTSVDEMLAESFTEDYLDEIVLSMAMSGNFDARDGKLFLSDGPETSPDPEYFEYYTLEGDTLTIDRGSAQEVTEFDALIYPMVLTRMS